MHKFLSGLLAGVALADRGARRARGRCQRPGRGGAPTRSCRARPSRPQAGTFSKDGDPPTPARPPAPAGALERATGGRLGRALGRVRATRSRRSRASATPPTPATRPAPTGRSGSTTARRSRGRVHAAGRRPATTSCSSRAASARAASSRRRCGSPRPGVLAAGPALRGARRGVSRSPTTRTSTPSRRRSPRARATVTAGGRSFTAGADGVAHVTVDGRSLAGVRATKPGHVRSATATVCVDCGPALGRRRRATRAPRPRPSRRCATARRTRAAGRRGCCAAA